MALHKSGFFYLKIVRFRQIWSQWSFQVISEVPQTRKTLLFTAPARKTSIFTAPAHKKRSKTHQETHENMTLYTISPLRPSKHIRKHYYLLHFVSSTLPKQTQTLLFTNLRHFAPSTPHSVSLSLCLSVSLPLCLSVSLVEEDPLASSKFVRGT